MNYASEHGIKADTTYTIDTHTIDTIQLKKPIKISHLAEVLQIEQSLIEDSTPYIKISWFLIGLVKSFMLFYLIINGAYF